MVLLTFAHGVLLGLAVAAPVGPISLLCMRRTLQNGLRAGLVSGLGAATADGLYAAVAAFGLVALAHLLVDLRFLLEAAGGLALIYLGLRTVRSASAASPEAVGGGRLIRHYSGTVALTLANPTTILSFVALFAGAGLGSGAGGAEAAFTVAGVAAGSALWWLLLLGTVALLRRRLPALLLRGCTLAAGAALALIGLLALADGARRL